MRFPLCQFIAVALACSRCPMPSIRILPGRLLSGGGRWGRRKGAGEHDGLVIAVALAGWYGEKRLWSVLKLPPIPKPPIEARQPTLDELIKLHPKGDTDGRRKRI